MAKVEKSEVKYKYMGQGILEPPINLEDYLLNLLKQHGPLTRSALVEISGIPRSTIYDTLLKLMLRERVDRYASEKEGRGRPKILFSVRG
ncbi:MAG: helix-turn-helix domain-containing protein [Candidatus Helarchaeota archaeon]